MKIYIAASFVNRDQARDVRKTLQDRGHESTAQWIDGHAYLPGELTDEKKRVEALQDLTDIDNADAVLFLSTPKIPSTSGGQHLEMGYAFGLGKAVYILGPLTSVFHFHPLVRVITAAEAI